MRTSSDYESGQAPTLIPREFVGSVLTLKQLWVMLWAYRWMIVALSLGLGVVTGVVSKLLPKVYQSTATLLVAFTVDDPISGREFSQMLAGSYMATQVEFLQSPRTLLPVVERLKLHEREAFISGYSGDGSPDSLRRWAADRLWERLSVDMGKTSRFIYVSAEDRDPAFAAVLANAVADSYVEEQVRQVTEPAKERAVRFSEQLESLKSKVDEAQSRVTAFRQRTGLIDLGESSDVDSARLLDLDRRMTEATARRQAAELRLRGAGEGDASVLGSQLVQNLKNQLQQKESQMAELKGSLGPRHPQILSLQSEIDHTRSQLNREISVYGQGASSEAESARSVEAKFERELREQRQRVLESRSLQDEGARLLRELETATKVYQGALDSFEKVQMGSQMALSSASIVTRATPALRPIKPKARVNAIMATVGGGLLACGFFLMRELLNRRVRCREDMERDLGIPVLVELKTAG